MYLNRDINRLIIWKTDVADGISWYLMNKNGYIAVVLSNTCTQTWHKQIDSPETSHFSLFYNFNFVSSAYDVI